VGWSPLRGAAREAIARVIEGRFSMNIKLLYLDGALAALALLLASCQATQVQTSDFIHGFAYLDANENGVLDTDDLLCRE